MIRKWLYGYVVTFLEGMLAAMFRRFDALERLLIEAEARRTKVMLQCTVVVLAPGGVCMYANLKGGVGTELSYAFAPEKMLPPGASVFVVGPALITNLLVGLRSQSVAAIHGGTPFGVTQDPVRPGARLTVCIRFGE